MRRLTEIIHDFFLVAYRGCLSKDGTFNSGTFSDECEVKYTFFPLEHDAPLPREVEVYLKRKGADHLVERTFVKETRLTLKRLSDGKKATFHPTTFFIVHKLGNEKLFSEMGFLPPEPTSRNTHGFHMRRKEYQKLAEFLREAGVKFEPDTPPWMEDVPKVKPSPDRPGMDAARFLGYG